MVLGIRSGSRIRVWGILRHKCSMRVSWAKDRTWIARFCLRLVSRIQRLYPSRPSGDCWFLDWVSGFSCVVWAVCKDPSFLYDEIRQVFSTTPSVWRSFSIPAVHRLSCSSLRDSVDDAGCFFSLRMLLEGETFSSLMSHRKRRNKQVNRGTRRGIVEWRGCWQKMLLWHCIMEMWIYDQFCRSVYSFV
jgi:hypothetical protein